MRHPGPGQPACPGLDVLDILARVLLPFLAANWLVAIANQLVQHGFHITFKP